MKYNLEIRAEANTNQTIQSKHANFIEQLSQMPTPWKPASEVHAPDPKGQLSCSVSVSKLLGKPLKGMFVYQFRRPFKATAADDDWIDISFNPEKIDYRTLIETVIVSYVDAFGAYRADLDDDEFIYEEYDQRRERRIDKRTSVFSLSAATYMSNAFCRRALGVDADRVFSTLHGHVSRVQLTENGILIVLTENPLPIHELREIRARATNLLTEAINA